MWSKAGHRITTLTKEDFEPERSKVLRGLAKGNSALLREGPGRYREAGLSLAVARAGWAWGHAIFDMDGDLDAEVYVANGMTSHSDPRAPDY